MDSVQKLLKAACEDSGEVQFRNDYSGRGMYGKRCVGITGSMRECQRVMASVATALAQESFETAIDCDEGEENAAYDLNDQVQKGLDSLMSFRTDSMGLDVIVYFEDLEPLTEEDDDLPTDAEIAAMDYTALTTWIQANEGYWSDDDSAETMESARHAVRMMRDRIRQDHE